MGKTMAMFRLEISCDNSAFGDCDSDRRHEIGAILRQLAAKIEVNPDEEGKLRDANGNAVGKWYFTE